MITLLLPKVSSEPEIENIARSLYEDVGRSDLPALPFGVCVDEPNQYSTCRQRPQKRTIMTERDEAADVRARS